MVVDKDPEHGLDFTIVIRPPLKKGQPVTVLSYKNGSVASLTSCANSSRSITATVANELRLWKVRETL